MAKEVIESGSITNQQREAMTAIKGMLALIKLAEVFVKAHPQVVRAGATIAQAFVESHKTSGDSATEKDI